MATFDSSIVAYFGGDTSGINAAINEVSTKTSELGKKMGDKLAGTRDLATAMASAVGLNVQNIAENVARFVAGLSEEQQKQFQELVAASEQATATLIAQLEKRRSLAENITVSKEKEAKLQKELVTLGEQQASAQQSASIALAAMGPQYAAADKLLGGLISKWIAVHAQTELAADAQKKGAELQAQSGKTADLVAKKTEEEKNNRAATMETMKATLPLSEQIAEDQAKIAELEYQLANDKLTGAERDKLQAELAKVKLTYQKEIAQASAEDAKNTTAAAKQTTAATEASHERFLTEQELANLSKEQLQAEETVLQSRLDSLAAEGLISEELQRQLGLVKSIIAAGNASNAGPKDPYQPLGKDVKSVMPLGLTGIGSLTTEVLQAKLAQINKDLDSIKASFVGSFATPTVEGVYGYANLASQADAIKKELAFRNSITSAYAAGGYNGALGTYAAKGYDALSFDNVISQMSSWSNGQDALGQKLDDIHGLLKNTLGG